MALFNVLEECNTTTSNLNISDIKADFGMLNALPNPILVRGENLNIIFKNKAAQRSKLFFNETAYHSGVVQKVIRKKSALLFQNKKVKQAQTFELEINEKYFDIHQKLVQTADGKELIIETLQDITIKKVKSLALHLLSLKVEDTDTKGASFDYFKNLTAKLRDIFELDLVSISMVTPDNKQNATLSFNIRGEHTPNFTYDLEHSPCGRVYETKKPLLIPSQVNTLFPNFSILKQHNLNTFYGVPFLNTENKVVGLIAIANQEPFTKIHLLKSVIAELGPKLAMEISTVKDLRSMVLKNEWVNQAMNNYQDPICVLNKKMEVIDFNKSYSNIYMNRYGVKIKKGIKIFKELQENNLITESQLNKRIAAVKKVLTGVSTTIYTSFEDKGDFVSYVQTLNPIFNHDKTGVREVLVISHETTGLLKVQKELERAKKYHQSIFENTKMGIGIYDSINQQWLDFNPQCIALFGIESKDIAKQYKIGELSPEIQPNGIPSKMLLQQLFEELKKNQHFHTKWTNMKLDGTTFCSETTFIPLNDQEQPGLYCVTINDISDQLAHQVILEQKNHELEQYIKSNMELENLAYSACHDLKEPLRTIGTFTQIIKNKYEDTIDDKSKEYMNFIVNGVKRMNYFVDGLFAYSRIRENKNEFETFSLVKILEFIKLDLNTKERNVVIQFQNIPDSITANRTKIKQLFQNLIANAIKFKRPNVAPEIKVTCTENSSHWLFSVSDNGIGIKKDYHTQIFILFRKLHSKDQFEGSGIGLALCKEVVEQHQGTFTLDSEVNKGTTFHFSIAKTLQKPALDNKQSPYNIDPKLD